MRIELKRRSPLLLSGLLLSGLLSVLLACAAPVANYSPLLEKLSNAGPFALSTDNPYIASNQLLARLMEKSPELSGFVKHRGTPPVMEIEERTFSGLFMKFYYLQKREYYELEESDGVWIIGGPYRMEDSEVESLKDVAPYAVETSPVAPMPTIETSPPQPTFQGFTSPATPEITQPPIEEAAPTIIPEPTKTLKPLPVMTRKPTRIPELTVVAEPTPLPTIEITAAPEVAFESPPVTLAPPAPALPSRTPGTLGQLMQETEAVAPHSAEISPKGDLVHYVTMPGETLSIISRWYTHDRENTDRIARLNKLKNSDNLSIGDVIVIPSYLIKNKNRLTEAGLENLKKIAEQATGAH